MAKKRTFYKLECDGEDCTAHPKWYYFCEDTGKHIQYCGNCRLKHLYVMSRYVCTYCQTTIVASFPSSIRGDVVCRDCLAEYRKGNLKVRPGKRYRKKDRCLRGNIDREVIY